jgi:GNAT superfamily N-acetyltransferase
MTVEIREVRPEDEAAWLPLWADYLRFYQVDLAPEVIQGTWNRLFDPASRLSMRIAVVDGTLSGFAIHHYHESTWSLSPTCYLEDLYLDPKFRGRGIGRALLDDLVSICRDKGCSALYWHTDHDNVTARRLYDRYAAADRFVRYRLKLN